MTTVVGIDFGNLFSSVAIIQNDRSEVVADSGGHRQLPSLVTYNEGKPYIGVEAQKIISRFPKSTITDLKSVLPLSLEQAQKSRFEFQQAIVEAKSGAGFSFLFQHGEGKELKVTPHDVLQLILQQLKKTAEDACGDRASKVVLAVPFHASHELKALVTDTSKRLGWNEVHFISEPAAVILAYELDDPELDDKQVIVVDFGSSLQVSHVSILRGNIVVKQCLSFADVSSKLIETAMVKNFASEFQRKSKLDIYESKRSVLRLAGECERVKGVLSQVQQASASVEGLMEGVDFSSTITRAKFEMISNSVFQAFSSNLKQAVASFGIDPDAIIICGGNCKIPKVQQIVQNQFPEKKIYSNIDPNEVHAKGAALQAKYLSQRNALIHGKKVKKQVQAIKETIGIASASGAFLPIILKDTPCPLQVSRSFKCNAGDSLLINVFEGENKIAIENKNIATIKIPDGDKTIQAGEVTLQFHVSEDGILSIQAIQEQTLLALVKFEKK